MITTVVSCDWCLQNAPSGAGGGVPEGWLMIAIIQKKPPKPRTALDAMFSLPAGYGEVDKNMHACQACAVSVFRMEVVKS